MRGARLLTLALATGIALAAASPAQAHHQRIDPFSAALFNPASQRVLVGGPNQPVLSRSLRGKGLNEPATPKGYENCGPHGLPETALQGQVPAADQSSGRSKQGYRCNLRLVGQQDIQSRGANFQLGWYKNCAYVGIVGNQPFQSPTSPATHPLEGVAVIDVSDPKNPQLVRILQSPMGRTEHEAVEVNERRGMLVVQTGGLAAQWVEIYDASADCRNPVFRGRFDNGTPKYHGQRISPDGRTVYVTDTFQADNGPVLDVIDVSDMSNPQRIFRWDPRDESPSVRYAIHDLDVNADGTRLYLGASPPVSNIGTIVAGPPSNIAGPSMVVLDVSDVQNRVASPDLRVVGSIDLPNFGHTEQRARINGKQYVFSSGEAPVTGGDNCPWAWGHVVDISDPANPKEVSQIKLEVNEIANCPRVAQDDTVYSIHYIGVDDPDNTTKVFYSYYSGGLRVFDVRDPAHPKEVAYYHPPPKPSTVLQPATPFTGDRQTPEWDSVTSDIHYRPETGQIWAVSIAQGFQVLEGDAQGGGLPGDSCSKRPRASIKRRSLRRRARGMKLSGRAAAFRCVSGQLAAGRVKRVHVSLGRRVRGGCRFLTKHGTFSGRRSCGKPKMLTAHLGRQSGGKVAWSFRTKASLPDGRYLVRALARDSSGRTGQGARQSIKRFTLR